MTNEEAAQTAAEAWLGLIDAGSYAQSWTEAAALFRGALTQAGWEQSLNGRRAPLGAMKARTLRSAAQRNEPATGRARVPAR